MKVSFLSSKIFIPLSKTPIASRIFFRQFSIHRIQFTVDLTFLYTRIPNNDFILAVKHFLWQGTRHIYSKGRCCWNVRLQQLSILRKIGNIRHTNALFNQSSYKNTKFQLSYDALHLWLPWYTYFVIIKQFNLATFYWSVCTKPGMYVGVIGINFTSFYDFSIGLWNCFDSVGLPDLMKEESSESYKEMNRLMTPRPRVCVWKPLR
jgi:hypothetical protein